MNQRTLRRAGIALVVVVVAVLGFLLLADIGGGDDDTRETDYEAAEIGDYPYPVQRFANEAPTAEGRHYAQGEWQGPNTTPYNTDPPTSGKHVGQLVREGVYDAPQPDEVMVHNMEHGYSIVWYNCAAPPALDEAGCTELRSELARIVNQAIAEGFKGIVTPDTTMEYRIALTAWQYMDTMDEVDEERIRTFLERFECHYDPEGGCT